MQGNVRKRGSTWSYQFYIGIVDGKKKYKNKGGFKTKGEASKALNEALYEFENMGFVEPSNTPFSLVAEKWLEEYVKPLRKITTYNRYKELLKKYILPSIGALNICDIRIQHIEYILMAKNIEISSSTLQSIYTLINTIMNRALKLRLIKENPCKYIERPKREKFTPDILTPSEISTIVNKLDLSNEYDYMFYIALRLTLELGLRRGELAGLEWNNLKLSENSLVIKNNMIYSNGHVYLTTPKTIESIRELYISDDLIALLKDLHKRQNKNKLQYGQFYKNIEFNDLQYSLIMRWDDGSYIHPMYYTKKLTKVIKACNIDKRVRFHDLRHTNATLLLQQGVNSKVVQERLGHKDIATTLNIYSHVNKKMQKDATDKLTEILHF